MQHTWVAAVVAGVGVYTLADKLAAAEVPTGMVTAGRREQEKVDAGAEPAGKRRLFAAVAVVEAEMEEPDTAVEHIVETQVLERIHGEIEDILEADLASSTSIHTEIQSYRPVYIQSLILWIHVLEMVWGKGYRED